MKRKKIISWVVSAVCILFLLLAIVLITLCYLSTRTGNRSVDIFGYSFSVVRTDSMSPEIKAGELITVKTCDISEATEGCNAVFIATEGELKGMQIVHKVVRIGSDERGAFIVTQGLKEGAPEDAPVYQETFVGIAVRHSVFWGKIATFFSTPVNWVLFFILLVGVPVVYTLTKKVVRFSKEAKKEKAQTRSEERERLKQELLEDYLNNNQTQSDNEKNGHDGA